MPCKEFYKMAKSVKPEKILESLNKLYEKRAILDKQILETEKSFVNAASVQSGISVKSTGSSKRKAPASRKPPVKKNKES
jgi:hypothetical protein